MPPLRRCPTCDTVSRGHECAVCGTDLGVDGTDVGRVSPSTIISLSADLLRVDLREHVALVVFVLKWAVLGALVGVLAGVSSAVFLYGLKLVTDVRLANPALLFGLPLGGLVIGWVYHRFGGRSAAGNNLILDEIHGIGPSMQGAGRVPGRLGPLVLIGTWVTHLFGGSAGREGTAIQLSASLSDVLARFIRIGAEDRRLLLTAAVSGGFASVFGVPLAGFVFGLEVRSVGRVRHDAIVPALTAAIVGNIVMEALHLRHDVTPSYELAVAGMDGSWLLRIAVAGAVFGAVALVFTELVEGVRRTFAALVIRPWLRPFVGGIIVVALTFAIGDAAYLGLSLGLIDDALTGADVAPWAFAVKLAFTALTLGAGFRGGEVTPLFVIGATLGAVLAIPLGVPPEILASVGFVAVFAAATNTPLACIVMGIELFGAAVIPYLAVGCVIAYVTSAHRGIYGAQRIDTAKHPHHGDLSGHVLRDLDARRRLTRRRRWSTGSDAQQP